MKPERHHFHIFTAAGSWLTRTACGRTHREALDSFLALNPRVAGTLIVIDGRQARQGSVRAYVVAAVGDTRTIATLR